MCTLDEYLFSLIKSPPFPLVPLSLSARERVYVCVCMYACVMYVCVLSVEQHFFQPVALPVSYTNYEKSSVPPTPSFRTLWPICCWNHCFIWSRPLFWRGKNRELSLSMWPTRKKEKKVGFFFFFPANVAKTATCFELWLPIEWLCKRELGLSLFSVSQ